jgi:hypothetical protein
MWLWKQKHFRPQYKMEASGQLAFLSSFVYPWDKCMSGTKSLSRGGNKGEKLLSLPGVEVQIVKLL